VTETYKEASMHQDPTQSMSGRETIERRRRAKTRTPGVFISDRADGTVVHEISYRDSAGKQRWETVVGGQVAAEKRRRDVLGRKDRGEHVRPMPKLTFGDAAERYMATALPMVRPNTRAAYESSLRIHLLPRWAGRKMDSISVDDVAQLIADMKTPEYRRRIDASRGRRSDPKTGYAGWTIKGVLTVLGRVFAFARRRMRWAGIDPVHELERSEKPTLHDKREHRILDSDEQARLVASAKTLPGHAPDRELILTALRTGARLSELLGVVWREVDLDAGAIAITHQLSRDGKRGVVKTKTARRSISLPSDVIRELRAHKIRTPASGPDDFVFAYEDGSPLEQVATDRRFSRAVRRAEIAKPLPVFHDTRHTHASQLIAAGWDVVEVSKRLGHASASTTLNIYAGLFEQRRRGAEERERLDAVFATSPGNEPETGSRSDTFGTIRSLSVRTG
jgi:integrase